MTAKICLIDGSGYIFRAFYGLPPLNAPDGTPVNAVYGFTNMFLKLTAKIGCDYTLVLFDAKRRNFRNDIFPEYKATRREIPEDLIPQFPIIHDAVSALRLNFLEMDGFEADDLIATYAKMALDDGMEVVVISGDKDLMQLIRPGVEFYDPMKDKFFTAEDVKEKFGVYPDRVVDVQALSGDSTDNVPGVPGIGPKTAAELVNTFGSLEQVLEHAGEIKQNKRREVLLANLDNARISKRLVKLRDDVPVEKGPRDYPCRCPDLAVIEAFVVKYGFNSLKPRVGRWVEEQCKKSYPGTASTPVSAVAEPEKDYETVTDAAALRRWKKQITVDGSFAFKVLAAGPNPVFDRPVGIAVSVAGRRAAYIPFPGGGNDGGETPDLFSVAEEKNPNTLSVGEISAFLFPLLADRSILKIGHDLKRDLHYICNFFNQTVDFFPYDDIEIISYVLDSTAHGHGLKELADLFLDYKMINPDIVFGVGKQKIGAAQLDLNVAAGYLCEQADTVFRLHTVLRPRLITEHMATVYEHYDRPLATTLFEMEKNGVRIDVGGLKGLSGELEIRQRALEKEIFELAGEEFNLGSPKQIGEILYNKLGLKGKKNAGGAFQTGAGVLEQMAENHPLPAKILDWRAAAKLKSTYTDALLPLVDKNERVHTTYSQTTVNTGRLSSVNPNLQNIPIRSEEGLKIRRCFVARPGYKLVSADYSQVELRLMAVIADVKALKEAFAAGLDIHTATAMQVFGLSHEEVTPNVRRHAKAINFGVIYGISQYGLAKQIGISNDEAKQYIDAYFAKMPEIRLYMEKTIAFARKYGYVVTPFGRKCAVPGINDKNQRISSFAERAAINAPLQGGAADIMKKAMNEVLVRLKASGLEARILLQVHDEMVLEAAEKDAEAAAELLKSTMENIVDYDVAFIAEVGIGDNWAEAH